MRVSPIVNYRLNNLDKCCKPRKMQDNASEVPTGRLDNGDKFLAPQGVSFGYIHPLILGNRDVKEKMVRKNPKYHDADMEFYRELRDSYICDVDCVYGSFFGKIDFKQFNEKYAEIAKETVKEFKEKNKLDDNWYTFPNGKKCAHNLRKFGELAIELQKLHNKQRDEQNGPWRPRTGLEALGEDGDGPMFWYN